MKKIKDRLLLGVVVGLGSNIVKNSLNLGWGLIGWSDLGSQQRATGMFLPRDKMASRKGKVVGYLADQTVACLIGCATVGVFSCTGKNKPVFRGSSLGATAWLMLYGVLGTFGATKINSKSPNTMLAEFASHLAFGATSGYLIDTIGDDDLFNGKIPMENSPTRVENTSN